MFIQLGARPDHSFHEPLGLLSDCHRRIERFLNVLVAITADRKGGALPPHEREQLAAALRYFATAALVHTADEEQSLFPKLRQAASLQPSTAELIERLGRDHVDVDRHHAAVDVLGHRWLAEGALESGDVTELGDRLAVLKATYDEHIGLEDRELFREAARVLPRGALDEIGREMAARRQSPPFTLTKNTSPETA